MLVTVLSSSLNCTYRGVGAGQLLRVVVVSIQGEGLFPEEGQNFGEGSCVVLWENLTITVKKKHQEEVNKTTQVNRQS